MRSASPVHVWFDVSVYIAIAVLLTVGEFIHMEPNNTGSDPTIERDLGSLLSAGFLHLKNGFSPSMDAPVTKKRTHTAIPWRKPREIWQTKKAASAFWLMIRINYLDCSHWETWSSTSLHHASIQVSMVTVSLNQLWSRVGAMSIMVPQSVIIIDIYLHIRTRSRNWTMIC